MHDYKQAAHDPSSQQRYAGYDRIMGNIFWLLIALVTLNIRLMPKDRSNVYFLGAFCLLLFIYNINARYGLFSRKYSAFKIFVDLMVFMAFIVAVCWYTGRVTSPFISLIYLILMATSLTQGKRVTYFMAVLAVVSYIFLASRSYTEIGDWVTNLLELFPFMLIAHLGAMLAGETESARREVERLSLTDEITGINNMRNFFLLAESQERIAIRYKRPFSICMIDADDLKKTNDQHGHLAGTELIRRMGDMISSNVRTSDICARYGGDEFVIMFTETGKRDVVAVVERIISRMAAASFDFKGKKISTTLSAGHCRIPGRRNGRTVDYGKGRRSYVRQQTFRQKPCNAVQRQPAGNDAGK